MAITDTQKIDFLWKKDIFGVAKTADGADKFGSNETVPYPVTVLPSSVWKDESLIPTTAPGSDTPPVAVHTGVNRIEGTNDPTSAPNLAWFATAIPDDVTSRMTNFIDPTFGTSYAVKVYIGDPNGGPAARIFPDTTGEEWVFNYTSGVLLFTGTIPSGKTATIGSGTVSVSTHGVFFEVYQYAGAFGVGGDEIHDGFELPLGGQSAWNGAVDLTDDTTVSEAIDLLNEKLGEVESETPTDGFHIVLGDVATEGDGSWSPGAVPFTDNMKMSEAMDQMNELMAKLIPALPPAFPNGTLTISNTAGNTPRLASGVTDNSGGGSGYTAGGAVTRITAAGASCAAFNDVGPGNSGTINALVNGVVVGTRTLNGTTDAGTYNGLVIADQKDYPTTTPGFWKSIDVSLATIAAPVGIDKVRINHTDAGTTGDVFFVRDDVTANPAVSGGTVVEAAAGTLAYSSSVPHYNTGASLTINASISNLAGQTYYGGVDPFVVSGTNGVIASQTYTYAGLGITTPIAKSTTAATAITPITVLLNATNVHHSGLIQGTAKNVNGSSAATSLSTTTVNVKNGTAAAGRVDEMSIPVTGLGSTPNANNAVRVSLGAGDTPSGSATAWNSTSALATHEAAVVGGVMGHNQNDYTNALPSGPNLSVGRSAAQYFTFSFNRAARSTFKIVITGTYAGCWVKLPGVSDLTPNAPNGWWNAFQPYDGAGVPGETGDSNAGCALGTPMTGAAGTFTITFGTESSTNATGNQILVRLKLNAGQTAVPSITN